MRSIKNLQVKGGEEAVREVFTIVENTKDGKDRWVKIGVAFDSEKGTSVILNALPTNGKLFIKLPKETGEGEAPF